MQTICVVKSFILLSYEVIQRKEAKMFLVFLKIKLFRISKTCLVGIINT